MKIIYKPFEIIAGLIGTRIASSVYAALWARIDHGAPPSPTTEDASFPKVVGAAALKAATTAGIGAAVDRVGARVFHHLTGIWPGEKHAEE
jgi:hypothetical protein